MTQTELIMEHPGEKLGEIHITSTKSRGSLPDDETTLKFGRLFTDHMFIMQYDKTQRGWHSPEIRPYGPLNLDPAASGIHYGQSVWEGLKCYRTPAGKIQLFRPWENFQRLNRSADRMVMPRIPLEFTLNALKTLIHMDSAWVPHTKGTSLYIRPIIFATESFLGVHPAEKYLFYIILSPSGPYYTTGLSPVQIYVESRYTRATEGGTGGIKNSGNYAGSLKAAEDAQKKGFTQVLWLDGKSHQYIEEIGMMNIMFKINGKAITPSLEGTILPGITRDSVIQLLKYHKIPVEERKISITEIMNAAQQGLLEECFGLGTAAVVSPIGSLTYENRTITINNGATGPLAQFLYDQLTGIQYGTQPDPFGWIDPISI